MRNLQTGYLYVLMTPMVTWHHPFSYFLPCIQGRVTKATFEQGSPHYPLPTHFVQLFQAFSSQPGDTVSPMCPGASTQWDVCKTLHQGGAPGGILTHWTPPLGARVYPQPGGPWSLISGGLIHPTPELPMFSPCLQNTCSCLMCHGWTPMHPQEPCRWCRAPSPLYTVLMVHCLPLLKRRMLDQNFLKTVFHGLIKLLPCPSFFRWVSW